jgi:hypothetical protein
VLAEGRETIEGEEDDVNFDDGIILPLRPGQVDGKILLHIEIEATEISP